MKKCGANRAPPGRSTMKTVLSLVHSNQTLEEYASAADLEQSYRRFGLDGLEVIYCGPDDRGIIKNSEVVGVHLPFYSNWLDFYRGDRAALLDEFLAEDVWRGFYGGGSFDAVMDLFADALDFAQKRAASYVVFHVTNVTTREVLGRPPKYSDEDVVDACAGVINQLLDGKNYSFDFLMENLHWRGLTLTRPEVTRRLLDQVHTPRKGILLDTGHLMCTNPALKTEEEGFSYIDQMLDLHGDLCSYIKGVHLHTAVTAGANRSAAFSPPKNVLEDFYPRFSQAYAHVNAIDAHQVALCPGAANLLRCLNPSYLTFEFCAGDRKTRDEKLAQQSQILNLL